MSSSDSDVPQFEFLAPYTIPEWLYKPSAENEQLMKNEVREALDLIDKCRENLSRSRIERCETYDNHLLLIRDTITNQFKEYEEVNSTEKLRNTFFIYIRTFFLNPPVSERELKERVMQGHKDAPTCSMCGKGVWVMNRHTCRCCKATICSWNSCARERPFSQINNHRQFRARTFDVTLCGQCSSPSLAWGWLFRKLILMAKFIHHARKYVELVTSLGSNDTLKDELEKLNGLIETDLSYDTTSKS